VLVLLCVGVLVLLCVGVLVLLMCWCVGVVDVLVLLCWCVGTNLHNRTTNFGNNETSARLQIRKIRKRDRK